MKRIIIFRKGIKMLSRHRSLCAYEADDKEKRSPPPKWFINLCNNGTTYDHIDKDLFFTIAEAMTKHLKLHPNFYTQIYKAVCRFSLNKSDVILERILERENEMFWDSLYESGLTDQIFDAAMSDYDESDQQDFYAKDDSDDDEEDDWVNVNEV